MPLNYTANWPRSLNSIGLAQCLYPSAKAFSIVAACYTYLSLNEMTKMIQILCLIVLTNSRLFFRMISCLMKKSETMSFGFKRKPEGSNTNVGMVRSKTVLDPVSELIPLEDLSMGGTSDLDRLGNTGNDI